MRYRHIFLDLDGTLTESGEGIMNGIARALEIMGLKADRDSLTDFIGPPLRDSFKRRFGLEGEDAERAVALYREYYRDKGMFENRPYPGIQKVLASLKDAGVELVVATAKAEVFAKAIMDHFDMAKYFSFLASADLSAGRVRKEDVLRHALEHSSANGAEACVMVGDTRYDVEGAHAVGMPCIGVGYGYGGEAELRAAGADIIAPTVADLEKILMG